MRLAVTEVVDGNEVVVNIAEVEPGRIPAHLSGARPVPGAVRRGHVWDGSRFVPPSATTGEVARALKNRRDGKRGKGLSVTVPSGGTVLVDTSREDTSGLLEILVQSRAGKVPFPITFKGGGTFSVLHGPEDIEALADAVTLHVQACYEAEAAAVEAFASGAATSLDEAVSLFESVYNSAMG